MAKTKTKKSKPKGLKNPAAIMALPEAKKTVAKVNKDTGNSLSWLTVAAGGAVVFLLYKVVQTIGKVANTGGGIIDDIGGQIGGGTEIGNPGGSGDIPAGGSISPVQAATIATQLASIFNTFGKLNKAEKQRVYGIMNGWNHIDYQLVFNAFGKQPRNPITGEIALPFLGTMLNLTEWLIMEMDQEGINHLKSITTGIF